jgi:6-phosphogluconolactonase
VTVLRFGSEAPWIEAALDELRRASDSALAAGRPSISLCLAGGATPKCVYRAMASMPLEGIAVDLWLGDERAVDPDDEASNGRMIEEAFSDCAWERAPRLHRWPIAIVHGRVDRSSLDEAGRGYAAELEAAMGPRPAFDLALLGLGADGHTMSLFPGSAALDEGSALAAVSTSPQPPIDRLTLTFAALRYARRVVFLAKGRDKAKAISLLEEGDPSIPASRLATPRALALYLELS